MMTSDATAARRSRDPVSMAVSPARRAPAAGCWHARLAALPTSPFWARRYTRFFLDSCRGISEAPPGQPNCSSPNS